MVRVAAVVSIVLCGLAAPARAGRTFFGWLVDTEVLPERGVELQSWVSEENNKTAQHDHETVWLFGPAIGIIDQLEIDMPLELSLTSSDVTADKFTFEHYGIEARYRLVTADPVDAPAFVPLVRAAVKRSLSNRGSVQLEADAVGSYRSGRVHAAIDAAVVAYLRAPDGNHVQVRPNAGVSIEVVTDLRFGAEGFGEWWPQRDPGTQSWYAVGPDLAWTHGRFWLSGAFGVGISGIRTAPRVLFGVLF